MGISTKWYATIEKSPPDVFRISEILSFLMNSFVSVFFFPSNKEVHRNCVIIRYMILMMDTITLHFAVKKYWRNVPAILSTLIKT